jgi:hypothetical protein
MSNCPPRNRQPDGQHTDSAKRCADGVNLAIAARGTEVIGKWLAVKLEDGSVEQTVYDYQSDAAGAMWPREREYAYARIPRQWMTLCEAESYLRFNRLRYEAGMDVMPDPREVKRPGNVRDVIKPLTRTAHAEQMAAMASVLGLRTFRRHRG